ncbi:hypothetical protein AnigIFM63604_009785 [Aspergillus niger]|uniref:DUF3533 domain-containing protein n=1 Tax=Aspergillus niger TaxID=5061 RepID=A0A9W6E631_ASPNG|nr:hypothetical protein AnigIFM63604_009785 [Aspergillus niger]
MAFYAAARKRPHRSIHDPEVRPLRLAVLKAATINLLILQLLFLGLFCYLFGSIFQQTTHIHNLNVLFVDYDGGAIGRAVRTAYQQLQGSGFPTLREQSAEAYPNPASIVSAVCNIHYWGGFYIAANASSRLSAALTGIGTATYNTSDVMTLVWNEARYSTVVDSAIQSNILSLSEAARIVYTTTNGPSILQTVNTSDQTAIATLADPWTLSTINIQPTTKAPASFTTPSSSSSSSYKNSFIWATSMASTSNSTSIIRQLISGIYTFIGSLCTTGAIWAFQYGWHVNGGQFMITWMALWLFAHLNFLVLDVFTIWLAPPFVPMALISWVVLNVSSILLPFELSPGFYKWGYALPAHAIFQVMVDIWSGGCNPQLDYALPVLFAYEVVGMVLSSLGVYRRAHYAVLAEEAKKESQERLAVEAEGEAEKETPGTNGGEGPAGEAEAEEGEPSEMQPEGFGERMRQEMSRLERVHTSRQNTGPSFDLPYTD